MHLELVEEADGCYWMVLGFYENMDQVRAILPTRRKGAKIKIVKVGEVWDHEIVERKFSPTCLIFN